MAIDLGKLRFIKDEDDGEEDEVEGLAEGVEGTDVHNESEEGGEEVGEEAGEEEWEEDEDDEDTPAWLSEQTFVVRAPDSKLQPSDGEPLATLQVTIISRALLKEVGDNFHAAMDDFSLEFSDFARGIFDPQLRLRPELYNAGTKAFGKECDEGDVAYLDEITVHPDFRSQGVGRWAIEQLLASDTLEDCHLVYTLPAILSVGPDSDDEDEDREDEGPQRTPAETHALLEPITAFFRSCGFRRVGTTDYLALPLASRQPSLASHPALALPASSDPPSSSLLYALLPPDELPSSFPLHHLILSSPPTPEAQRRLAAALRAAATTRGNWVLDAADPLGDTPLHTAARVGSSAAVTVLLAAQGGATRRQVKNVGGLTPLDMAERAAKMEGADGERGSVLTLLRG